MHLRSELMPRAVIGTEDASVRLLIVDEDQRTIEAIEDALKATTIAVVHVARSGQDGIDFLDSDGVDVIAFRIPLPDRMPLELARELARRWPDSRVIAYGGDHREAPDLLRAGIRDWVAMDRAADDVQILELVDAIVRAGSR